MDMLHHVVGQNNNAIERLDDMTVELENLKLVVAQVVDVQESAIVLIEGIAAQLEAIKDDPAAISALAADLTATSAALAAAIDANDGIDPVVVEEPVVIEEPVVVDVPVEVPVVIDEEPIA